MPCPKYWRDSKHGGIAFPGGIAFFRVLAVPERSHNHAHNALPQVLAGFRINQGIAFPQVLAVPGPTVKVLSPSTGRTTNDPDEPRIRACGVAVRCEERNTVFAKGSKHTKLGRSHQLRGFLLLETMRGAGLPRTESWKIGFQDQACRNALSNFPALSINP